MTCDVCGREQRGFGFQKLKFCSAQCQNINYAKEKIKIGETTMIDPTEKELTAIDEAGAQGGEYLESIGKTDLAVLNEHEWHQFIRCVIGGFTESLVMQEAAVTNFTVFKRK